MSEIESDACPTRAWRTMRLSGGAALILAQALEPVETATTVRVGKRKLFATDGRFAETKEQPGGSILIEVRPIKELKPSLRRIR